MSQLARGLPRRTNGKISTKHAVPLVRREPVRQRPEAIANAKVFAPGQEKDASEAADVNEGAPDGPPKRGSSAQLSKRHTPSDFLRRVQKKRRGTAGTAATEFMICSRTK